MASAKEIAEFLNEELKIHHYEDSCSNGLQVENKVEVTKIGFAVDACQETFEKASQAGCQLLITHHGLIWDSLKAIKGDTYVKIKCLLDHQLALYSVHLPLDLHHQYGNNIKIAELLNLNELKPFGYYNGTPLGFIGSTDTNLEQVRNLLRENGMKTLTLNFGPEHLKKIAVISGGASKELYQAVAVGADLYITGEPLHFAYHTAKENRINVIFGGHYETEVFGVKALMPLLKDKFNVQTEFIDVPTTI